VILPPPPKKKPSQAMFFSRDDVKPQLAQPLRATLPTKPPSIPSLRKGPVKDFLERITGNQVYNYDLTQAQDASVLLELAHFSLKSPSATGTTSTGTP
jgi:hypothetical protein